MMQNPHANWRIDFARHLAGHLAGFEGIRAIVIAGSVARGYADEYSDIELPIFWETSPSDSTRQAVVRALYGKFLFGYDGPAHEDQLLIDGVQVDLWDVSVAHQEDVLDSVLSGHQTDLGSLNAMDTIRTCIPLFGQELVQKWKLRAQEYPDELAKKIIQEHLAAFSIGDLFIQAQRNNPTAFYARLSFLQQEAFLVLLALNRRYFPTYKWMYPVLEAMKVKPEGIERRIQRMFEVTSAEAIADTKKILEEVLALVEGQFPDFSLDLVHQRLAYIRDAQNPGYHEHFCTLSE